MIGGRWERHVGREQFAWAVRLLTLTLVLYLLIDGALSGSNAGGALRRWTEALPAIVSGCGLLAPLLALATLERRGELTARAGAGAGPLRMLAPTLVLAAAVAGLAAMVPEILARVLPAPAPTPAVWTEGDRMYVAHGWPTGADALAALAWASRDGEAQFCRNLRFGEDGWRIDDPGCRPGIEPGELRALSRRPEAVNASNLIRLEDVTRRWNGELPPIAWERTRRRAEPWTAAGACLLGAGLGLARAGSARRRGARELSVLGGGAALVLGLWLGTAALRMGALKGAWPVESLWMVSAAMWIAAGALWFWAETRGPPLD